MDREELMDLVRQGPTKIRMNDGREFIVDNIELIAVSSMAAHLLQRDEEGRYRAVILPLVTMTGAEELASSS